MFQRNDEINDNRSIAPPQHYSAMVSANKKKTDLLTTKSHFCGSRTQKTVTQPGRNMFKRFDISMEQRHGTPLAKFRRFERSQLVVEPLLRTNYNF